MIWEIAFFRPRVDAENDCDAGAGCNPGGAGFWRLRYFAKSRNERVIDLGELGTDGNNVVMGETFRRSTLITHIGRFPWELVYCG